MAAKLAITSGVAQARHKKFCTAAQAKPEMQQTSTTSADEMG